MCFFLSAYRIILIRISNIILKHKIVGQFLYKFLTFIKVKYKSVDAVQFPPDDLTF